MTNIQTLAIGRFVLRDYQEFLKLIKTALFFYFLFINNTYKNPTICVQCFAVMAFMQTT